MGRKRNRRELTAAHAASEPVLARRNVWKADHLEGFVVDLDEDWVVLNLVYDVSLNGWSVVRMDTLREIERQGSDTFIARALDWYSEEPMPLEVDLESTADLLRSAAARFPVLTLYTEVVDHTVCVIGRPQRITAKKVDVLELSSEAVWSGKHRTLRLDDITRVDVGGRYETVLHHLGGYPPVAH